MDVAKESDDQQTSSATTMEGEEQGACIDACSICLEDFTQSDPSTVTGCKHEFHLHCILEWSHRSFNCPMCWQPISLRDAASQELIKAVENEKSIRANRSRYPTAVYPPTLSNFNLHLPTNASELDLEEHIFQHLAAAASMRSGHHVYWRRGGRVGLSSPEHQPLFIFSGPTAPHDAVDSIYTIEGGSRSTIVSPGSASLMNPNTPVPQMPASRSQPQMDEVFVHRIRSSVESAGRPRVFSESRRSSHGNHNTAELSDLESFSESLRSRLNSWSLRYKESISRNTRGWKERIFARSSSVADLSSEVRREVNFGISRMMERLDSRRNSRSGHGSESSHAGRSMRSD